MADARNPASAIAWRSASNHRGSHASSLREAPHGAAEREQGSEDSATIAAVDISLEPLDLAGVVAWVSGAVVITVLVGAADAGAVGVVVVPGVVVGLTMLVAGVVAVATGATGVPPLSAWTLAEAGTELADAGCVTMATAEPGAASAISAITAVDARQIRSGAEEERGLFERTVTGQC